MRVTLLDKLGEVVGCAWVREVEEDAVPEVDEGQVLRDEPAQG